MTLGLVITEGANPVRLLLVVANNVPPLELGAIKLVDLIGLAKTVVFLPGVPSAKIVPPLAP
jgi:hypothetical protein